MKSFPIAPWRAHSHATMQKIKIHTGRKTFVNSTIKRKWPSPESGFGHFYQVKPFIWFPALNWLRPWAKP
jgi:hypothetical protein